MEGWREMGQVNSLIVVKNFKTFKVTPFNPAGNYMFKVNNRNTRKKMWNMFKFNKKDVNDANVVALVSLLLTLNIFHTLF